MRSLTLAGLLAWTLLVCAAPLGALAADSGTPERELVLGLYAHIRSTEVYKKFEPIARYLESALAEKGVRARIRIRIYATYDAAIDALARGEPDFARYGPVSYVLAKSKNPGIGLLAMESNAGRKTFEGVISVPGNSSIRSLSQLRGKRVAFGARQSTTGRYLSQAALVKAGITGKDIEAYSYLGRHDKVAFAVASKGFDAGATNENTFDKYAESKGLRAIATFPCVTKPWAARAGMEPRIFQALRAVLLEMTDPALLKALKRDGLLPAEDADYDMIREGMRLARTFDETRLTFGVYTSEKPTAVYNATRPVLDALRTGLEIEGWPVTFELKVLGDYAKAIKALAGGELDLARLGPASYVLAKTRNPAVRMVAREVGRNPPARGHFVTTETSGIDTLADLAGRRFAFGNRHSTAGRYIAQAELARAGVTASDLASHAYLGRHDKVVFAVAAGTFDAGVARDETIAKYAEAHPLKVIGSFEVPDRTWVARAGLGVDLAQALTSAFVTLRDAEALAALGRSGFEGPDDAAYDGVRAGIREAERFGRVP